MYQYPFFYPDLFDLTLNKHELQVRLEFIKGFSSVNIEKTFVIKYFFQNYPVTLTNQQKTKMKSSFIELVKDFEDKNRIKSNYKTISKHIFYDVDQLTTNNISEGFVIYEKLQIIKD